MDIFVGTISAFGFNFATRDWQACQGQIIPISSNTALFALLGTAYGGNGTSTFGLPNLTGRVAIHQGSNGQSSYQMGNFGGNDSVTLLGSNLPSHNHPISLTMNGCTASRGASSNSPVGTFPATSATPVYNSASSSGSALKPPTITLGNTGGTTPISVQDPGLVMNYCIALFGVFPTRN